LSVVTTTDVATITAAIKEMLLEHLIAHPLDATVKVERADAANTNPEKCPWVGVYRARQTFVPRTLGISAGHRNQRVTCALVANEGSVESGEVCENRLEALLQRITSALLSDVSLRGTVAMIEELDVSYDGYAKSGASFFQQAVVTVTAVIPVS
jgi:hypothetical protein